MAVPYVHKVTHKLKRIGAPHGVPVVPFAPKKLVSWFGAINKEKRNENRPSATKPVLICLSPIKWRLCTRYPFSALLFIWHRREGASMTDKGSLKTYSNYSYDHLTAYSGRDDCVPDFPQTRALASYRGRVVQKAVEAYPIKTYGNMRVTSPNLALLHDSLSYLDGSGMRSVLA